MIILNHMDSWYKHSAWYNTLPCSTAQMISQPPENTTAALGANATFSCHGTGSVLWQINGTQVQDASQLPMFSNVCVFVPLPNDSSSELIMTASTTTNASLTIVCVVQPSPGVQPWSSIKSSPVQLLVYGKSACMMNIIIIIVHMEGGIFLHKDLIPKVNFLLIHTIILWAF